MRGKGEGGKGNVGGGGRREGQGREEGGGEGEWERVGGSFTFPKESGGKTRNFTLPPYLHKL